GIRDLIVTGVQTCALPISAPRRIGVKILGDRLRAGSLYRLLADHGQVMFPDGYFADLYTDSARGRPTVPARVMATVMLLQSFEEIGRASCRESGEDSEGGA